MPPGHVCTVKELVNAPRPLVLTTIELELWQGSWGTIQFVSEHSLMVTDFLGLKFVPTRLVERLTITLGGRATMWGDAPGPLAAAESGDGPTTAPPIRIGAATTKA